MKILALSDQVEPLVYSEAVRQRYTDVDLVVGCGDLPEAYLEYVVTQLNVPMVYVPGNHDADTYDVPGGINIDGRIVSVAGLMIGGLGGSRRYKPGGVHQYSGLQMRVRAARFLAHLTARRLRYRRGLDVFVTHAPPLGIHDQTDLAHTGFEAFHDILRVGQPGLMLHGHVHVCSNLVTTETERYGCRIVNVFPRKVVSYERP